METDGKLSMAPVHDFPHEKRTLSHLPPPPPTLIWPRIRRVLGRCLKLAVLIILSTAFYLLYSRHVIRSVEVSGESMLPTLNHGDRYLLNLWSGRNYAPERGDIVVLRDPVADCFAVKRIIGLSGESIYLKNGEVYVNNQKLSESYLPQWTRTFPSDGSDSELYIFGTNRVFVLGDNRGDSADSREYGPIRRDSIVGKLTP